MTVIDTSKPDAAHADGGLSRAIVWVATTIAKILHDSLDLDGKERRRRGKTKDEPKPPDAGNTDAEKM